MSKLFRSAASTACSLILAAAIAEAPARAETVASPSQAFQPSAAQATLIERARALGVTDLTAKAGPRGGLILNGRLAGRQFALAIPAEWKGEALLHAHGYTLPGTPLEVHQDPSSPFSGGSGIMSIAYEDGLAAGHSSYEKAGMAVEAGAVSTLRLRDLMKDLGAKRIYASGASMGGNIVLAMIEERPDAFDGAFAQCGVTDGWERELEQLTDMRAAYIVLTRGTPYALPGGQDATRSAMPILPPPGVAYLTFQREQVTRLTAPIAALFQAAEKAPDGPEARIIRQVASIGGFEPELASFFYPLMLLSFGADDMRATFGGQIYGNVGKVYRSAEMTEREQAAFNRDVQRFTADPAAVAQARRWKQVTGRFRTPLVTIHNRIDSLVPYAQAEGLGRIVRKARNDAHLVQFVAPPVKAPLPIGGQGYDHCGFTRDELRNGLNSLRTWVEDGRRPAEAAAP
ncbi:alpha/beta hydrolase family protein [Phenylobacterium sp. VNQ135]|uniref:alpha/beta hydrolase family protein n=1 Tax=Phenylobacterium sp. VNQ135 TaxID=3400922 RepID=UPI003C117844